MPETKEEDSEVKKEPEVGEEKPGETETSEEDGEEKNPKKNTENWPLRDIKEPHENDVLYGRGGGTNHHPGNKRYRKMVEDRKLDYVNSKRLDKPLVALEIIREWRGQDPPGRFLKMDEKSGLWQDVGDKKAREKTSQALREKAPLIRKQQEQGTGESGSHDDQEQVVDGTKNTRFAEGTKSGDAAGPSRAVLARDHSLGREYIAPGEPVSLEGFSWEDPIDDINGGQRKLSGGMPPPPQGYPGGPISSSSSSAGHLPGSYPNSRTGSASSVGYAPRVGSQGSAPFPPDYHDRQRQFSGNRYESWGSLGGSTMTMPLQSIPPQPMPYGQYPYDRSGGSGVPNYTPPYTAIQREHSLQGNNLRNASLSQPMAPDCFEAQRANSGYWPEAPHIPPEAQQRVPPVPSWSNNEAPPRHPSGGSGGFTRASSVRSSMDMPQERSSSGQEYAKPSSPYNVDPSIAHTWSSQSDDYEKAANVIGEIPDLLEKSNGVSPSRSSRKANIGGDEQHATSGSEVPRPTTVKRATSNQNENVETKRDLRGSCVKRAALNRDNSLASNRLKAAFPADKVERGMFDSDREIRNLSTSMEQSTLGSVKVAKPRPLTAGERNSTLENIAMDLFMKPEPLKTSARSSTIEALLDLDDDPLSDGLMRERLRTSSTDVGGLLSELAPELAKPTTLTAEGRTSTVDSFIREIPLDPLTDRQQSLGAPLDMTRGASVSEWLPDE